jgi:outer membrane protein assembly factor BamB
VYLNQHSLLAAYHRSTGELLWSRELEGIYGWLSVADELVVVGGWRGYTPIRALSLLDGSDRWHLPDGLADFARTQIHGESRSLIAVAPTADQELWFFDLDSGRERGRLAAPGGIELRPGDGDREPAPPTAAGPVVLVAGDAGFLVVDGSRPSVERVDVPDGVESTTPAVCAGPVAFTDRAGELWVWWAESPRLRHLGKIDHNDRHHLPVAHLGGERFVVGTSDGLVKVVGDNEGTLAQRSIGKRVSTSMTVADGVVVVGTSSGEVLGLRIAAGD